MGLEGDPTPRSDQGCSYSSARAVPKTDGRFAVSRRTAAPPWFFPSRCGLNSCFPDLGHPLAQPRARPCLQRGGLVWSAAVLCSAALVLKFLEREKRGKEKHNKAVRCSAALHSKPLNKQHEPLNRAA